MMTKATDEESMDSSLDEETIGSTETTFGMFSLINLAIFPFYQTIYRAFQWKIDCLFISDTENSIFDKAQVPQNYLLRSYMVWRWSALICFLPLSITDTIIGIIDFIEYANELKSWSSSLDDYYDAYVTSLGWVCIVSQGLLPQIIQLLGATISLFTARKHILFSLKVFRYTVALSILMYVWPTFVKGDHYFTLEADLPDENAKTFFHYIRSVLAMSNSFIWMPLILALPNGAILGGTTVMGLLSDLSIPGLLVVFFAPFSVLILLGISALVVQLYGNYCIAIGITFLVLGKLRYFYFAKLFLMGRTEEILKKRIMPLGLVCYYIGLVFITFWLYETKIDNQTIFQILNISGWTVTRFVLDFYNTLLLYRLFFADVVLFVTLACEENSKVKELKGCLAACF
mmetsp:Transcript_19817/g.24438  ORF Transcript_19817/g.24438 Transcript_19817/m.24438 type:complete len:401 (-) Transcript_19817:182-1384(-)